MKRFRSTCPSIVTVILEDVSFRLLPIISRLGAPCHRKKAPSNRRAHEAERERQWLIQYRQPATRAGDTSIVRDATDIQNRIKFLHALAGTKRHGTSPKCLPNSDQAIRQSQQSSDV